MTWASNFQANTSTNMLNNAATREVIATPVTGADHAKNASALLARAEASFAGVYQNQMRDVGQAHLEAAAMMYQRAGACFEQLYTVGLEQGQSMGRS